MRKIITILSLATFIATSVFAQTNYIPLKTDSAVWVDLVSNGPISIELDHYRPVGDTIINNISYTILTETHSTQNSPVPTFGNEDTIGFYRNDSINKKVYFLPIDSTAEELFYDFDLSVSDTLPETFFMRGYNNTFIIDSIGDTTFADNVVRKTYYYHLGMQSSFRHSQRVLVEGIGTLAGFTSNFIGNDLSNYEYLSCYKEAGSVIYFNGPSCPPLPVSLDELEIKDLSFTIYPNPSEGEFNLNFAKKIEKPELLQITNLNGQAVKFEISEKSNNQLKVRLNAPPGIYLLRLGSVSKKVIVW